MTADPLPWAPVQQARRFARHWPALLPAALFSALLLEWVLPILLGEMRMLAWPFALAIGNAWLLGGIARAQGLTRQPGWAWGWSKVGDLLACAAMYSLITAMWLFAAVGMLRSWLGRPLLGIERDPQSDAGFAVALLLLGYLLLRCTTACLGPLLDEARGHWPRGPRALWHGWRLSRGHRAHLRVLLPMAAGTILLVLLQQARESVQSSGFGWLPALAWHLAAWPAFSWLCLERSDALAAAAERSTTAAAGVDTGMAAPHGDGVPLVPRTPAERRAPAPPTRETDMRDDDRSHYYSPDWSADEVFVSAAINGDASTLRRLIAEGSPVDTVDHEGVAALLRAALAERPAIVRLLLQQGADVGVRDRSGRSLVHVVAAYPATLPLLDEVLARGLSVDDQHDGGDTPLMTALLRGHLQGAHALLARGADPLRRDRHGDTSVIKMIDGIYAFRRDEPHDAALALLDELLVRGVDPRTRGRHGRDAVSIAAGKGLHDVLAVLHRHGAGIGAPSSDGLSPLQQAWWGRHAESLAWLLQEGVALDFHSAVALGRGEQVEAMLAERPDRLQQVLPTIRSAPLGIAIHQGQADMVRRLLRLGADPNGPDPLSGSLANAVRHLPERAVLCLLVEHGAALDAADGDGNTALNLAARDDRVGLAEVLLDAGADPNARTERGYPVLVFARSEAMRALLRRHGGVER